MWFCFVLLAASLDARAQYSYVTNQSTITITRFDCSADSAIIPSMINGLPVTQIGSGAFVGCDTLTSVTIPNGVTSIEAEAFLSCGSLTEVFIPNSVTNIGNRAFFDCYSLEEITLPEGLVSIGEGAFADCSICASPTIRLRN